MLTFIYTLADPVTGMIRYIGATTNPTKRYRAHLKEHRERTVCSRWITALAGIGKRPIMKVVAEIPEGGDWRAAERAWIKWGLTLNLPLTNIANGQDARTHVSPDIKEPLESRIARLKLELFAAMDEKIRNEWMSI